MRHIIVEGCDGSGKTGLIGTLMDHLGLVRHARASDSLTGPVPSLRRWVDIDLQQLEERPAEALPYIYDRHPLISELIYADYRWRNPGRAPGFTDENWLAESSRRMGVQSVLVICCPPFGEIDRVLHEQGREAHMPGVFENRLSIWMRYNLFRWPGRTIRYDRTRETPQDLIKTLENM